MVHGVLRLTGHSTTTGICKRGLSCQYKHDPAKIAICHGALTPKGCTKPPGTCLLSHDRTPNRVPHCMHYLSGECRYGDSCFYVHSDVLRDKMAASTSSEQGGGGGVAFCPSFSTFGWCDKGIECDKKHTWECPEFAEKGSCSRPGCRLAHVITANNTANGTGAGAKTAGAEGADEADTGEMGDDMLFVRDDAAAADDAVMEDEEAGDSDSGGAGPSAKRKFVADEAEDGTEAAAADEAERISWMPQKKKSKAFANQQDFISFGDDSMMAAAQASDDDEEDDDSEEEHAEQDDDANESVHSEEEEEEEEDEGSDEEEESSSEDDDDDDA